MNKVLYPLRLLTLATAVLSASTALSKPNPELERAIPRNMEALGPETYITLSLNKLASPKVAFVDLDLAKADGLEVTASGLTEKSLKEHLEVFGFAGKSEGEPESAYGQGEITVHAGKYGGDGMSINLGDGRSTIVGKYRVKGGAKTELVLATYHHSSGTAHLAEAIRESIIGNVLNYEMPYGAHRTLSIITTGTRTGSDHRALIVSEDPLRFAHYLTNIQAQRTDTLRQGDNQRIRSAMTRIVEYLPKPKGINLASKTRQEKFLIGLNEMIDRQAKQHAYAWAHRFYHGACSSSNAAIDGRYIDFGTLTAFNSFAHVQILDNEGASGDVNLFIRDMWTEIHREWSQTLPADLKQIFPSQKTFFARFVDTYESQRRLELVRKAGVISEFENELQKTKEAKELGEVLYQIADAGHDQVILPTTGMEKAIIPDGKYDLARVLQTLAQIPLNATDADQKLKLLISDEQLRYSLIAKYQRFFKIQQAMAHSRGIVAQAEASYRNAATVSRNRALEPLFRNQSNLDRINAVIEKFEQSGDSTIIQNFVQSRIDAGRREFRDAAPFTVVIKEVRLKNGDRVRRVFDALGNHYKNVTIKLTTNPTSQNCENILTDAA